MTPSKKMTKQPKLSGPSRYGAAIVSLEREPAFTPGPGSGLDVADLKIIDILLEDGRANNRSMTERVGLTEETVDARIRQMIDRGIIGITAIFDWRAAGYSVDLWLRIECERDVEPVAKALASLDEVVYVSVVLGTVDIVAHVLLRDMEAALEFTASTLTNIPGIARVDTSIGLETVKFFHQFARNPTPAREITLPAPVVPLGDLDWSIIDALVTNGRASNREIARSLGVSDGTIRTRLRRMEDAGLIRVCAQVHPSHSGMIGARTLLALSVRDRDTRDVATALAAMPEVLTVSLVSGRLPIMAYVVASSRDRLVELITDEIRMITGVRHTKTYDIIEFVKAKSYWARW